MMKEEYLYDSYRCPNCNQIRKLTELTYLLKWNEQFKSSYMISVVEEARQGHLKWACDDCIKSKRVVVGKAEEQNWNGITYPFFTHNDEILECQTCKCSFEFSKEEKKFWYEDLKFIVWSYPKNCASCRRKIREPKVKSKRLTELITNIENTDTTEVEEIIDIFLEYGNFEKAKYYLSVLRKRNAVDQERISFIKEKIHNLSQQNT
ncbi:zinc-ribbon domain containing protein [Sabulibacter ruber]|uniref:zinc-ribbon domain containing protein n=1 Tax=Sabulibacter ruber TaxID=2811901 RepID=UPI001A974283|nr:zinc-ribbon domain containing protein [Sabulibacter ruber]